MAEPKEQKPEGLWGRLVTEIMSIIPKDMKEMVGFQIGMWLFVLTPMLLVGGATMLLKLFKEPKPPEVACWQIQKLDNRLFKLNACTGETIELRAEGSPQQDHEPAKK